MHLSLLVRTALSATIAVACLTVGAGSASAAPRRYRAPTGAPTESALEEAKARYSAGNRAVQAGRWADALADFEQSYALSGVPAALFNLATTLRAIGRYVEARDAFDQYLASHPDHDPATRARAREMLEELDGRIAKVVLDKLPARGEAAVFVDGRAADDEGARPLALRLDPGRHEIRVERSGFKPFRWSSELKDGDTRRVTIKLDRDAPAPVRDRSDPPKKKTILSSPVFWTVMGVVVVGAAGGAYWTFIGRDRRLDAGSTNVVRP